MATAETHLSAMQKQRSEHEHLQSVAQLFRARLAPDGQRKAARYKAAGKWQDMTWADLNTRAEEAAWGLIAIGVNRGDTVSIIANTRLEWIVADVAAAFASGTVVPIYQSNTPEEVRFILDNAGVSVVFAEDQKQLGKLLQIRDRVPKVRHVILLEGEGDGQWVLSMEQLKQRGREAKAQRPGELQQRVEGQKRDDLSMILYTSGTTGLPKGVMITNDNMIFGSEAVVGSGLLNREDSHLLFLPLAHSFAQLIKTSWFGSGLMQIFAESVDKLVDNASETGPTIMSGVPRVYEKAFNSVVAGGMANPGLQGALFRMAMREFELYSKAKAEGKTYGSLAFTLAKKLVFPKVKDKLRKRFGGRIDRFGSGGAPLAKKIGYFFDLLGFNICEGYGLTETTAVTSVNLPGALKLGTVGRPYPGVEVKIAQDGEILQRGRHVMRGYYNLPEATAEAIDKDGWYYTGDIGELDADGYLTITDRKKDLIKTSGGKYIAPQALEGALKTASELISQVVVIGDRRKYVSVLVTVVETEAVKLTGAASYAEATRSATLRQRIQEAIDKVNATVPSYETIKRFTVLERDFSQESGEMTPTLKVKRKVAATKFKKEIDSMYDEESID